MTAADAAARIVDAFAFVWFVLQRGAPVFETLLAVLLLLLVVRFVTLGAEDAFSERYDAFTNLFPPTRSRGGGTPVAEPDDERVAAGSTDAANVG